MRLLQRLAQGLALPPDAIRGIAGRADHAYKVYTVPKRNGGKRAIHHPSRALKTLQRWILQHEIGQWPVHQAAKAYRRGSSIAANAEPHRTSRYLLRLDIANFFPSITADDLRLLMDRVARHLTAEDQALLLEIACLNRRLTIGAPSSPALSNACCYEIDNLLQALDPSVAYTRYADDMFFSTSVPEILKDLPPRVDQVLRSVAYPSGLVLNPGKTFHASRKNRRVVTGIVVGSDQQIHLGRHRKRAIRAMLHKFGGLSQEQRRKLAGMIAQGASVDRNLINDLVLKYGPARVREAQMVDQVRPMPAKPTAPAAGPTPAPVAPVQTGCDPQADGPVNGPAAR